MNEWFPGRVGIWTGAFEALPPPRLGQVAAELDELGYASLWFGEAYGREAFTHAALLLAVTRRATVATGIANIYARDAMAMNAAARTLTATHPGRFLLGLGVSHAPLVERMRGHEYRSPVATMRTYLDAMDAAPFVAADGSGPPPRVLAALGPRMLDLARDRALGAHPYLVTPEHTRAARVRLGPEPVLAVEQAVALTTDRDLALRRAHDHLEIYTGLPNYRNSWTRLGFAEEDFVRGGSERLAEALVAWGDVDAIRSAVAAHLEAGATQVCVQVLGDTHASVPLADWRILAPALVEL
ncbi:MAG: LLM class F420-dependent oxidoreductase [Mycobacteriales bacterium]